VKIAIITFGDPNDKKGAFNATHQRIKHLINRGIETDVFIIRYYQNRLIQLLRKKKYQKETTDDYFIYDDIKYHNMWVPFALTDYIQWQKCNQLGSVFLRYAKKVAKLFEHYDLISAHSFEPAVIASLANKKFGTPFAVTWHGSDIHTMPGSNRAVKKVILDICSKASLVFFVSKQLKADAASFGANISNSEVLYNAVNKDEFKPYPPAQKNALKTLNNIDGGCNISFVGALAPVKNCQVLPEVFKIIADNINNCKFYFVGDGKLKTMLIEKCGQLGLNVVFMGNRPQHEMAGLINCFDLVVLPSINEGMPLIVLECLSCQTPIVASRVGGIPEILEDEFTVSPGPEFAQRYATTIIRVLKNGKKKYPILPDVFNWESTASKEALLYKKVVER